MPDKDLRRGVLDKTKTVSRKAQAKSGLSSPGHSQPGSARNSRSASRIASRDVSDDEDERGGNLSDDTNVSINSIDAFLESEEFAETNLDTLKSNLSSTIDEIIERKGSSVQGREEALERYTRILISHHFGDVLYGRVDAILTALSKSIKSGASSKETILALRAVSLTAISFENLTLYDNVAPLIKRTISDSQDNATKAAAIHCLGICLSFGGAGEDEIADQCTFLLEVVQSDGSFINAEDDAEVVTAAIQTYSFLITQLDDVEDESENAVEAFLEQLNSGNVNVQIAAGEAIALLFEKSYTPREDDETLSDVEEEDEDSGDSDGPARGDKSLVKRYNAYHNPGEVIEKVSSLAGLSTKVLSKNDKKRLHQAFASITITVENPRAGLQTNNSSRMIVRIHREGEIKVDKWWKLMRLNALRRLLAGGFINHYFDGNKQVLDSLPLLIRSTGSAGTLSPRKTARRPGDKYRESRRFVSAEVS